VISAVAAENSSKKRPKSFWLGPPSGEKRAELALKSGDEARAETLKQTPGHRRGQAAERVHVSTQRGDTALGMKAEFEACGRQRNSGRSSSKKRGIFARLH
jgi:hypothetical protein